MTLDQVRVFIAVAEHQHVTRAAEHLHLAQSAVSHAIAALEDRHGVRLFNRVGRRIELSTAGAAFLPEARRLLLEAQRAETALADLAGLKRGRLTLAASLTIASYWLPRHLAAFRIAYPALEVSLSMGNTRQVAEAVETGAVELGLVEGEITPGVFTTRVVARDQLLVVVPPGHVWTRTAPDAAAILKMDWVLRERGSGTRSEFEAALAARRIDPAQLRVALELPSNEAVRGAVEAGLGASALSASVAAPSLEAGLLDQALLTLPDRQFQVLHHRQRPPGAAALAFLAALGGN